MSDTQSRIVAARLSATDMSTIETIAKSISTPYRRKASLSEVIRAALQSAAATIIATGALPQ